MKAILKYPGAKNRLAPWICRYIPEHKVYLEPFAGSLAVFFNKPKSYIETVNDLDGEIINFFKVVRDSADELKSKLAYTPYARQEYDLAFESCTDEVERARRFCIRCWMGFGNGSIRYRNGFKTGQQKSSPNPAKMWSELPDVIDIASERLKGVQIECQPALALIEKYNTSDVFIYADPPYLQETRKKNIYNFEMTDADHIKLLTCLARHPGKVLISGYDNALYNGILTGWDKIQKETTAECGKRRVETLWANYSLGYRQSTIQELLENC